MTDAKKPVRKKEWFDSEILWRETFPFMFPEERFASAAETVEKALKLADVQGKTALDLCCGPGRCSVALSRTGFAVTGVDRTKYLLDKARVRGRSAQLDIEWIQQDMRDFLRPGAYDLALSMFTSFGYFENRADDEKVLSNVFRSLRPGGAFVIELMGKEILAKIFQPMSAETLPDGSMLVEQRKIIDDWTRVHNVWTVLRNGKARKFSFHLNLYSGQELREKMEDAGFAPVKLFGSLAGDPYGPAAKRLIAVGWKLL